MSVGVGNVIDLGGKRAELGPRELRQVEAYWDGLRGGRLVPDRSEVDPRGLSPVLRNCILLEKIAPGLARIRISGRQFSDLMGIDVEGMPLSAIFLPESRPDLVETLSAVLEEPAVARLTLTSPGALGRHELPARMILLPLRDDMGDITRVLGCLVTDGPLGRTPRRFAIVRQARETLLGYARQRDALLRPATEAGPNGAEIVELRPRDA